MGRLRRFMCSRARYMSNRARDRKSTRLNSSHSQISYAVFCLKKKKISLQSATRRFEPLPDLLILRVAPFDRGRHKIGDGLSVYPAASIAAIALLDSHIIAYGA